MLNLTCHLRHLGTPHASPHSELGSASCMTGHRLEHAESFVMLLKAPADTPCSGSGDAEASASRKMNGRRLLYT